MRLQLIEAADECGSQIERLEGLVCWEEHAEFLSAWSELQIVIEAYPHRYVRSFAYVLCLCGIPDLEQSVESPFGILDTDLLVRPVIS